MEFCFLAVPFVSAVSLPSRGGKEKGRSILSGTAIDIYYDIENQLDRLVIVFCLVSLVGGWISFHVQQQEKVEPWMMMVPFVLVDGLL